MALIVQKFGGSSVKDRDRIFNVARIVANTHNAGNDVVVVVSAQGDTTDDLITKAAEISHDPSAREMDMLLATGEQISISLLAMALNEIGCHAISLTGWQAGFRTDRAYTKARITRLETERISSELERNRVVVVAGFQGLNKLDDITTLGRGGSDTSAVAIAAALHADRCQIFQAGILVALVQPLRIDHRANVRQPGFGFVMVKHDHVHAFVFGVFQNFESGCAAIGGNQQIRSQSGKFVNRRFARSVTFLPLGNVDRRFTADRMQKKF